MHRVFDTLGERLKWEPEVRELQEQWVRNCGRDVQSTVRRTLGVLFYGTAAATVWTTW